MKLTEEQRQTIIRECKKAPVMEVYRKLGYTHVSKNCFYNLMRYRQIPVILKYHKDRTPKERRKEVEKFLAKNPSASKSEIMRSCRIGLYDLNPILKKMGITLKSKTNQLRSKVQVKEEVKAYFEIESNRNKNKTDIAKELKLNYAHLINLMNELGITIPSKVKREYVKPKEIKEKIETIKGFCNSCSKETELYLVVKVETIKTKFSSFDLEQDRYLCIDCKG